MLGLLALCFVDCDSTLALVALCLSVGFGGSIYYGYMCSHQDLAPNFAGFLMGMSTTMGNIPGLVAPQLSGLIISGNVSRFLDELKDMFLTVFFSIIFAECVP